MLQGVRVVKFSHFQLLIEDEKWITYLSRTLGSAWRRISVNMLLGLSFQGLP